ncbi:MAG: transposase [Gemmataceae bacterium]
MEPDSETFWQEARPQVDLAASVIQDEDAVLDKPYARHIDLVGRHWSGKHYGIVQGIDLVLLLWTDGDRLIPCEYRINHDAKVATRNDHFRAMIDVAHGRGFQPACVLFDCWYSSLENLKHLRSLGWKWLTPLKSTRLVNKDRVRAGQQRPDDDRPGAATACRYSWAIETYHR